MINLRVPSLIKWALKFFDFLYCMYENYYTVTADT